jgi:hypothetical protein
MQGSVWVNWNTAICGRHIVRLKAVRPFPATTQTFHKKSTVWNSTVHSAGCVIWSRAFCVWFMGDVVLLEAVRPFPAATRTFTKRLCSDIAEHGRRTVLYVRTELGRSVCGLWATWCCSKRFVLFRLPRELSRNGCFLTDDFRYLVLSVWINAARYSRQMVLTQSHGGLLWITLAPSSGSVAIERLSKLIQFQVHWKNFHIPKGPCSKSSLLALILFQDWNNFVGQCWHLLSQGCFLINYWQMCKQLLISQVSVCLSVQNITPRLISL